MYVEKPIVRADSYMPDAQKKQAQQLTRNGFRFRSTQRERVTVSFKIPIKPKFLQEALEYGKFYQTLPMDKTLKM